MLKLIKFKMILFLFVCFTISPFSSQTEEIIVDESRGRNQLVPFTLIREKGTFGTVTVNFEVRGHGTIQPTRHSAL